MMYLRNISNMKQTFVDQGKQNTEPKPSAKQPIKNQGQDHFQRSIKSQIEEMEQERKEAMKQNPPKENPWEDLFPDPAAQEAERSRALTAKFAPIQNKMISGKLLTPAEKSFLQKNYPQWAMVAQRVEREVQDLRNKLKRSKSKEENKKIVEEKRLQMLNGGKRDPFPLFMSPAIDEVLRTIK